MYTIIENEDLLKVNFEDVLLFHELEDAIEYLLNSYKKQLYEYIFVPKFKVFFKEKSKIFNRNKFKMVNSIDLTIFKKNNEICYRIDRKTGYYIKNMDWENIESIELWKKNSPLLKNKNEEKKEKFFKKVTNMLYDDLTWSNLDKNSFGNGNESFYYLKKLNLLTFDKIEIEKAFKEKNNINIKHFSKKMNYLIKTKMCDDGIFRAWFSSKYIDSCNESNYFLLNPNVAIHIDND